MQLRGIVRAAELQENPPGTDQVELVIRVQGVKPGQPRALVIPYEMLLADASLDPDEVLGKGFQAEAVEDASGRWVVTMISVAGTRMLRDPEN
jgi:hypothetical protein